uniref:SCO-spondin n=1 Tax=Ciona intestinalis TaxID=7719 RepID=F6PUV1_CIOIN|nr:SCO-spondin [Ciona intestinalis]|eukprot:XP_002126263.1 SCO-spondin [Ciona intestinalis]
MTRIVTAIWVFSVIVVFFTIVNNGCHVARHARKKRQTNAANNSLTVEETRQLRDYFASCMTDKISLFTNWNGVIDYTILDTNWYFQADETVCAGTQNDTVPCWESRIDIYLRPTSVLTGPAKECIRQLQEDVATTGTMIYRSRTKRQAPVPVTSDFLREQYVECVRHQLVLPPNRRNIDIGEVVKFVEDHAICGTCDLGRNNNAFIVSEDTQLTSNQDTESLVATMSQSYTPTSSTTTPSSNSGLACGTEVYPFRFQALTKLTSPLFSNIVTCNEAYRNVFLINPCSELINQRSDAFCRSQLSWCDAFGDFMRQNCGKACCEKEQNALLDAPVVGWTEWTSWGTCPAPCGQTAVQTRSRMCPLGEVGVSPCLGLASETRTCHPVIVCASWTQWQAWSACSVSCEGVGTFKNRYRTCQGGNPGDRGCEGPGIESQACGREVCPEPAWAPWSSWSDCSWKRRTRVCVGGICPGEATEFTECQCGTCHSSVAPEWQEWSAWSDCSALCGRGVRRRARICQQTSVIPRQCPGSNVQVVSCNGLCLI